jgi:dTDP-4-dehydrorhamnose reductase
LRAGKNVMGFTDVTFCPLLVNDLAGIFLKMLASGLSGLYHVVSSECISKYDFGVAIAEKFGFDPHLIIPKSVEKSGLKAKRAPNLSLKVDKLTRDLDEAPPNITPGLERFFKLYRASYPRKLMAIGNWE